MRHARTTLLCLIALGALLPVAGETRAQETHALYKCADRIAGGLRDFTEDATKLLTDCETKRLSTGRPEDCAADADVARGLQDGPVKAVAKVAVHKDCDTAGVPADQQGETRFRALCPVESRNTDVFKTRLGGIEPGTVLSDLALLSDDLFATSYPGCVRPAGGTLTTAQKDCANQIAKITVREAEEMVGCYISCERSHLADEDYCVNPDTGVAGDDKLASCLAKNLGELSEILNKCDAQTVEALGCPLGAGDGQGLVSAIGARLTQYTRWLNRQAFHASCRTSLPGGPPPELVPADVTLEPSLKKKQVSCGQVLDAEFFGNDKVLSFDSDLDCSPTTEAVNGIVIAKPNVVINGRGKWQISGPSSRRLRSGVGILVLEGKKKVRITGFRRIQNFGVGILAEAKTQKLRVNKVTLFRNLQAGIRVGAPKIRIVNVIADRNGIGFDVSSNNSQIRLSESRRSEPQSTSAQEPLSPGYGFYLSGSDNDGNGVTVRCSQCSSKGDLVAGMVLDGDGQLVETSTITGSAADGVLIIGTANRFRNNSIKKNAGNGVVVSGDANLVNKNQSDENLGAGFVVPGTGNTLRGNGAGSLTDKGNADVGFLILGPDNLLDTNKAEANGGGGFAVHATTALFKGNRSEKNSLVGFDIATEGVGLNSNVAEKNADSEFVVAPNNLDQSGNRANGNTISIPPTGGVFE